MRAIQSAWWNFLHRVRMDARRFGADPAVVALYRLQEHRAALDEQAEILVAWARYRGIPRRVIGEVLGEGTGTNLELDHPQYAEVLNGLRASDANHERRLGDITYRASWLEIGPWPADEHVWPEDKLRY